MNIGAPVISKESGMCHFCNGYYFPGDLVAIDEDLRTVHLEHSVWDLAKI